MCLLCLLVVFHIGTSDWFFINFLINFLFLKKNEYFFFFFFINALLFLVLIVKTSLAPIQLYKLEIYKSMQYIYILFYVTIFFFIYVFLLMYIYMFFFFVFFNIFWFFFCLVFLVFFFYLLVLVFEIKHIQTFLAYSTLLNNFLFFLTILSFV